MSLSSCSIHHTYRIIGLWAILDIDIRYLVTLAGRGVQQRQGSTVKGRTHCDGDDKLLEVEEEREEEEEEEEEEEKEEEEEEEEEANQEEKEEDEEEDEEEEKEEEEDGEDEEDTRRRGRRSPPVPDEEGTSVAALPSCRRSRPGSAGGCIPRRSCRPRGGGTTMGLG